jgi:hypothetical protein
MAKSAKTVEVEITKRDAEAFVSGILAHFENIESAKGTYMQAARSEREGMQAIYEGMAAKGVPQKVAKIEIQIVRTLERLKGLYSDLEAEDQKILDKLARAQADAEQMSLFGIDALPKKPKKAKVTKLSVVPNGNGEHGSDEFAADGAA